MAQRVVRVDDLDGTIGARTVTFSLDDAIYTIDLAEHNLARLREELAPYVAAGRQLAGSRRKPVDRALNRAVRAWAAEEGITLNKLGRIPDSVLRLYENCPRASSTRTGAAANRAVALSGG